MNEETIIEFEQRIMDNDLLSIKDRKRISYYLCCLEETANYLKEHNRQSAMTTIMKRAVVRANKKMNR